MNTFVIFVKYFNALRQKLLSSIRKLAKAYVDGDISEEDIPDELLDVVFYYTQDAVIKEE